MQPQLAKHEITKLKKETKVHRVLANSYSTYLLSIMVAFVLYLTYPVKFENSTLEVIGLVFMIAGTMLIVWAQTSTAFKINKKVNKEDVTLHYFARGPYHFLRSPTNVGLFMTFLGFGLMLSSLIVVFISLVTFLVTRFVFIAKQEKLLEEKYGDAYREYKKRTCVF